ncbi:MAG: sodium-independent anion transporter [Acidovorax sp.]|nr:sodium-independent anion transporter [Acidovorax sp.]
MLLKRFAQPRVSWLGRLPQSHDFVDAALHPEAQTQAGLLIARPEAPLFFGNVEPVLAAIGSRVQAGRSAGVQTLVLSLEESSDLDGSSLEALASFAVQMQAWGVVLRLARCKDGVRALLQRADLAGLPPQAYAAWSVADAVEGQAVQAVAGSAMA